MVKTSKDALVGPRYHIPAELDVEKDVFPSFYQLFQIKYYDQRGPSNPLAGADVNGMRRLTH